MLRDASFRTKMLLVVVPPLAVLGVLVFLVVNPELNAASSAAANREEIGLGSTNNDLLGGLQAERGLTVVLLSNPDVESGVLVDEGELVAIRNDVDASIEAMRDGADAVGSELLDPLIADVLDGSEELDRLRELVDDREAGTDQVIDTYSKLAASSVRLNGAIGADSAEAEIIRQSQAMDLLVRGIDQTAEMRDFVAARLYGDQFTAADYGRIISQREYADNLFAQFEVTAPENVVEDYRELLVDPEFGLSTSDIGEIVRSGVAGGIPPVAGDDWVTHMNTRVDMLDGVQEDFSEQLGSTAAAIESDANTSARLTLVLALAAAALAAVVASLMGRSLSRRLGQVSSEATEIATEKLPEVLETLRHPTPEALAGALPQVHSTSSDEVGSMADAFNTVLRTSVETSIEHSEKRAETLTSILVSLGRRNQSLIDRQLDLIDHLEASQKDPEVLEGLFKLDHMVTSMRRNAENLLVLASDDQARPWTDPVPMLDVVRGAVSEVADMQRVDLDLVPGDHTTVSGRAAVDLSHVCAELLENATSFSPPTTAVAVRGETIEGGYRLTISDQGFGIPAEEMEEFNDLLAAPRTVDELATDRVGFQVVSRLANRLGLRVRLEPNPGTGVIATMFVPDELLESAADPDEDHGATMTPPSVAAAAAAGAVAATGGPAPATPAAPSSAPSAVPPVAPAPVATQPAASAAPPVAPATPDAPSPGVVSPLPPLQPAASRPAGPSPAPSADLPQRTPAASAPATPAAPPTAPSAPAPVARSNPFEPAVPRDSSPTTPAPTEPPAPEREPTAPPRPAPAVAHRPGVAQTSTTLFATGRPPAPPASAPAPATAPAAPATPPAAPPAPPAPATPPAAPPAPPAPATPPAAPPAPATPFATTPPAAPSVPAETTLQPPVPPAPAPTPAPSATPTAAVPPTSAVPPAPTPPPVAPGPPAAPAPSAATPPDVAAEAPVPPSPPAGSSAAPAPSAAPTPATGAAPGAPDRTPSGLVRRTPGSAFSAPAAAAQIDAGDFRRLPDPSAAPAPTEDDIDRIAAERRLRLSRMTSGVAQGRATEPAPADTSIPTDQPGDS